MDASLHLTSVMQFLPIENPQNLTVSPITGP